MTSTPDQRRGRPVVFLVGLCLGWVALRVTILALWPEEPVATTADEALAAAEVPLVASEQALAKKDADRGEARDEPARPADDSSPATSPSGEVLGLDPAPPAHLQGDFGAPSTAAAHASLWIAASGSYEVASDAPDEANGPGDDGEAAPKTTP